MPAQPKLEPKLDAREVDRLLTHVFPRLDRSEGGYETVAVVPGGCTVRLNAGERHLRPGGTVSALFMLADFGGHIRVLSHAGPDALPVTTNMSINSPKPTT